MPTNSVVEVEVGGQAVLPKVSEPIPFAEHNHRRHGLPVQEEIPYMLNVNRWICTALMIIVWMLPAFAGDKEGNNTKAAAEVTGQPGGNASLAPASGANVTALLGVLVMKGVLAPSEANAIRNAAPEAEFQMLVEALTK